MRVVKNGCGQSGYRTLKLTISQEYTDGVSRFFNAGANSGKLQVASIMLGGHGQKWEWPFSSLHCKICFNVRMSLWIEQIFCMMTVMQ